MAGGMVTRKTLFLDEKDYKTFFDFRILMINLATNLTEPEIDDLQEAIKQFVKKVDVEEEGEEE